MLESVRKYMQKKLSKNELIHFTIDRPEHSWIKSEKYILSNFLDFLERLPKRVLEKVFYEKMTVFSCSSGKFACSVTSSKYNVIIIFPEVYELLTQTYDGWAKAVLAHEVGHIYLDHGEVREDPMEAQVDADNFACDMGYLKELEDFLHERAESVEKRVRLSFLTNYYFANVEAKSE